MSAFQFENIQVEVTDKLDFCPFCTQKSTGQSARSTINRHIKTEAKKQTANPDENNPHPAVDDERFKAVAAERNLYSKVKDEDERMARRAETQRKNLLKRGEKNKPKVEQVFESLRGLVEPRTLSKNASFAELVVYLLPEKEWLYLVPKESTPVQAARSNRGTRPPMLTDYHYDLLKHHPDCDKAKLEAAYKDWKKLHEYEFGAEIGTDLLNTLAPFRLAWNIFNEIKDIFTGEDEVLRASGREKWIKKGVGEAVRDSNWEMFGTIQKGIFDLAALVNFAGKEMNPLRAKGYWRRRDVLGNKLQSSK